MVTNFTRGLPLRAFTCGSKESARGDAELVFRALAQGCRVLLILPRTRLYYSIRIFDIFGKFTCRDEANRKGWMSIIVA